MSMSVGAPELRANLIMGRVGSTAKRTSDPPVGDRSYP